MSDLPRNRAYLRVSLDLLRDRLGLPEGTVISIANIIEFDVIEFGVEGASLPEVSEYQLTPRVQLIFQSELIDGVSKIYGSWSHKPDDRWLIGEFGRLPPFGSDLKNSEAA